MLLKGDCLEMLKTLPDNSVDSIVTDPPYGLEFMGKDWDAPWRNAEVVSVTDKKTNGVFHDKGFTSGVRYNKGHKEMLAFQEWFTEIAKECLRVLKPGGHFLAFGGTRTYHRLACAIEDAGFEIRDSIHWTYGSGFPKSMDISKAIDKRGGADIGWFGQWLRNWREENGISQKEIAALFPSKTGNLTGCVANWELGMNLPTASQFNLICEKFGLPFTSIEEAKRAVVGSKSVGVKNGAAGGSHEYGLKATRVDITAPATPEAQQWQGWGTALKPSHEPIVVARKPLSEKTVAQNVLKWGTGAINIDATRVGASGENFDDLKGRPITKLATRREGETDDEYNARVLESPGQQEALSKLKDLGRWPANTIITHSPLCRQVGTTSEIAGGGAKASSGFVNGYEHDGFVGQNITTNVWNCAEGCPALNFPDSKSTRIGNPNNGKKGGLMFGGSEQNLTERSHDYRDEGSAARFFTQTEWVCSADCPTQMFPEAKGGTWNTTQGARHFNNDGEATNYETSRSDNTVGSASRFFTTTGWECSADCPTMNFPSTKSGSLNPNHADNGKEAGTFGAYAGREITQNFGGDSGSAARFFTQTEWECSADCPTQMFPNTGKSPKPYDPSVDRSDSSMFGIGGVNHDAEYGDSGSASRFFTTTGWECSIDCPTVQFPETASTGNGSTSGFRKGGDNEHSVGLAGEKNAAGCYADGGSASRFFTKTKPDFPPFIYMAKASKADKNAGLEGLEIRSNSKMFRTANNTSDTVSAGFERFDTKPAQNFHPTVKPVALMQHLIRLVTPVGGKVLDPFLGSGTTAVAAVLEGFDWIGCEITPDYWQIIDARIAWAENQITQPTQDGLF